MNTDSKALLIEGPVGGLLIRLTIPMIFGILSTIAFNLVDTFFIGQLGTHELAAIGFTFPVIFVIGGVSFAMGIGTSAVVSRAIGENNPTKVRRLTTDSLLLSLLLVTVLIVTGFMTIKPVFRLLGATETTLPLIEQYMRIWYPGMIFLVIPLVGNNAIRATGDTKTPSLIMLLAVIVNTILDPLLIFGLGPFPRLELEGAAIATVIARFLTLIFALWVLYYRDKMISLKLPTFAAVLRSWRDILDIGLPAAATNIIRPLTAGFITRLVASYGPEAVAAYAVATRIDIFALTVIMALSSVLGPFIGQNLGAARVDRVHLGIRLSQRFAFMWGVLMFLIFAISGRYVGALFNENPKVIEYIALYLLFVPVAYGTAGIFILCNSSLNVLGKPLHAAALAVFQMIVLLIPLALAGSYLFNLTGVFLSIPLAQIIAGLTAFLWLNKVLKRDKRSSGLNTH